MTSIVVAPCASDAGKWAVEHWHYSHALPGGRKAFYGVWEDEKFIGVVIFGDSASGHLGAPYGLVIGEVVELTRVALDVHQAPVSQIMMEVVRQFKATNPRTRLIVSFADPSQHHHGGIYQAANFIFTGRSADSSEYILNGRRTHSRTIGVYREHIDKSLPENKDVLAWLRRHVAPDATKITEPGKYRYLLPLDRGMRRQIEKLRQTPPHKLAEEVSTRDTVIP